MHNRPKELCQLAGVWKGTLPDHGAMVEPKMDGWRALCYPDHTGKLSLFTRNGQRIEGVGHILHELGQMADAAGQPMFFDGELQIGGTLASTKQWCESGWKHGGEAGIFHAFDCLTFAEWRSGGTKRPLVARKGMLADLATKAAGDGWTWRAGSHGRGADCNPIVTLPDEWVSTPQDVAQLFHRTHSAACDGVMVKDAEAGYIRDRSDNVQKVKQNGAWMRRI